MPDSLSYVPTSKDVEVERLKRLPNLTFMFQFNRDKLLEQYEYRRKTKSDQPKNLDSSSSEGS